MKKRDIKVAVQVDAVVSKNTYDALMVDYKGLRKMFNKSMTELLRRRREIDVLLHLLKERTP